MKLKIREYRERRGITQSELAKNIGKSFRTLQSWERGESYPNADYLCKLCEYFDTDPNTFVGWYDEHPEDLIDNSISAQEQEALDKYSALTTRDKLAVDTLLDTFTETNEIPPKAKLNSG